MSDKQKRCALKVKIFNIIFLALSVLSIFMLVTNNFLSVKVGYLVKADFIKENVEGLDEQVDVDEVVGDGINIELEVSVTNTMLIKSFTEKDTKAFLTEQVINANIDKIVEDVKPLLGDTVKKIVKSMAKTQVKNQVKDEIKASFGPDADIEQTLEDAQVNVGASVDAIFEAFTKENANVDDLCTTIVTQVNDAMAKLRAHDAEHASSYNDIAVEDIKTTLEDALKEFGLADDEGNILSFDEALLTLLDNFTNNEEEECTGSAKSYVYAADTTDSQLAQKVKDMIQNYLPDNLDSSITLGFKAVAGVEALFLFTWAWVGLWSFLKLFAKKRAGFFTGLVCFVSSLLQIILGIALTYGLTYVMSGNIPALQEYLSMLDGLSLVIATSATIPAFCCLAKFVLNIPYLISVRQLKKANKEAKEGINS